VLCVRVCPVFFFLCFKSTTARPTERYVRPVLSSSRYGYCWSSGASPRTTTREARTQKYPLPFPPSYVYLPPRTQLHTHARDVKTADPPLHHRSLLLSSSFSLPLPSRRSSPLSLLPLPRSSPTCSASPVGLPHGQRIRKRGYTCWINFIEVLSGSAPYDTI